MQIVLKRFFTVFPGVLVVFYGGVIRTLILWNWGSRYTNLHSLLMGAPIVIRWTLQGMLLLLLVYNSTLGGMGCFFQGRIAAAVIHRMGKECGAYLEDCADVPFAKVSFRNH